MIEAIFGSGKDLAAGQMCARAVVLYAILLIYVRASGRRTFGRLAAFDNILTILLGSLLSRAVVGASPFGGIVLATLALVAAQLLVGWLCHASPAIRRVIQGEPAPIYRDGRFDDARIRRALMTRADVLEGVRMHLQAATLDGVDQVILEANGKLSVVEKKP